MGDVMRGEGELVEFVGAGENFLFELDMMCVCVHMLFCIISCQIRLASADFYFLFFIFYFS